MVKRNKFLRKKEGTQQTFVGLEDVFRTSSRHVLDVFNLTILRLPRCRKRLEDVLKTFGQDEYKGFHQDEYLLGNYYKHVNFVQKKGKKEEFRNFRIKEKLILWVSGG